ncbi:MAG: class I SAM-dependent methyltransferase [Candidatus Margulisbacteria bacterium]|nr:class I SAM-dependent methyltransferase [Candidatus Margulisiibacteriota bacterium]
MSVKNFSDQFNWQEELNIWQLKDFAGLPYSDGEKSEQYLRQVLTSASDLSSSSSELAGKIIDWPSCYHLSPNRPVLLKPFAWQKNWEVLELGGGCGALTRFLGENCKKVDMVEGNPTRAALAALRCRDLKTVDIYAAPFNQLDYADRRYDVVTLIGVLEYAHQFNGAETPQSYYLSLARKLLKKDGVLVVAIENKFGLKYFSGCSEDHTARLFSGIEGYPPDPGKQPVTFGLPELKRLLRDWGFKNQEIYFPYPDYKLPSLIVREAALLNPAQNYGELVCHQGYLDYLRKRSYYFSDRLASYELGKDQALGFFAPSFLLFASQGSGARRFTASWEAKLYSLGRAPQYQCLTTFESSGAVKKAFLHDVDQRLRRISSPKHSNWIAGQTLYLLMARALSGQADPSLFYHYLAIWKDYLSKKRVPAGVQTSGSSKSGIYLSVDALDSVPWNIALTDKDELKEYDFEWTMPAPIPLEWVIYRGLYFFIKDHLGLKGVLDFKNIFKVESDRDLIKLLSGKMGVGLEDSDVEYCQGLENNFQLQVAGRA